MEKYMRTITYAVSVGLVLSLFTGCGGDVAKSATATPTTRASFYITKGNFVDVASFAYKRATDKDFTTYALESTLPGSDTNETAKPSAYNITEIRKNNQLKKIIVENYQNSVEVKMVDNDRVNVLFQDANFTVDRQMSFNDFIAQK